MGLLSELEAEVQRREDLDAEARKFADEEAVRFQDELVPAVRQIFACLDKLANHLNYLAKRTAVQFSLPGYGDVTGRIAPEFEVSLDESKQAIAVQLQGRVDLVKEENPVVEVTGDSRVRALKQLIQELRLASSADVTTGGDQQILSAKFQVHGSLALQCAVTCTLQDRDILLRFVNFDDLGERHRRVGADGVNDGFLDQLARFVAREDNDLLKEDISSDLRRQLRRQVEMNRLKRKWEDKMTTEQPAVPQSPKLKESVGGVAKRVASLGQNLKLKFSK